MVASGRLGACHGSNADAFGDNEVENTEEVITEVCLFLTCWRNQDFLTDRTVRIYMGEGHTRIGPRLGGALLLAGGDGS